MTTAFELRRLRWEAGEVYRVFCDPRGIGEINTVGKVEQRGSAWVAINCGDMLYPNDKTSFPTSSEAAESLIGAYSGRGYYRQCQSCGNQLTELEMILADLCSKCIEEAAP